MTAAGTPVTAADCERALADRVNGELPERLFDAAAGWRFWRRSIAEAPGSAHRHTDVINPVTLAGKPVQPRRWIIDGWSPYGMVSALYGEERFGELA